MRGRDWHRALGHREAKATLSDGTFRNVWQGRAQCWVVPALGAACCAAPAGQGLRLCPLFRVEKTVCTPEKICSWVFIKNKQRSPKTLLFLLIVANVIIIQMKGSQERRGCGGPGSPPARGPPLPYVRALRASRERALGPRWLAGDTGWAHGSSAIRETLKELVREGDVELGTGK